MEYLPKTTQGLVALHLKMKQDSLNKVRFAARPIGTTSDAFAQWDARCKQFALDHA